MQELMTNFKNKYGQTIPLPKIYRDEDSSESEGLELEDGTRYGKKTTGGGSKGGGSKGSGGRGGGRTGGDGSTDPKPGPSWGGGGGDGGSVGGGGSTGGRQPGK